MRSVFEEEEEAEKERAPRGRRADRDADPDDEYAGNPGDDREVTLSSTTLLLIFFGLVLICALFFGLGYTLGRRSPAEPTPLQPTGAQTAALQSKPSAAAQPSVAQLQPQAVSEPSTPDSTPDPSDDSAKPESASPKPAIVPAPEATATPHPVKEVKAALPTTAPAVAEQPLAAAAGTMVQIAAISNPADADVLVRALQKRGYSVTVRHAPTDTLLHVQIGPYPIRADAVAMRQRLLADGYNAILK
jgi:cell division septation protein DedD